MITLADVVVHGMCFDFASRAALRTLCAARRQDATFIITLLLCHICAPLLS